MTTFGPIAYEDFSHLNAEYQEERPPMAGLGVVSGEHAYVDLSYLNAHFRPIWPKQVGTGNGILSGNSIGIMAGLGEDPSYPWGEYSADTKALQEVTNEALAAHGYEPLTADGKLGARTCGAIRAMCDYVSGGCEAPATCKSFTEPTKIGSGGGGGTVHSSTTASMIGGASLRKPNYLLIGGAVAAIAVGGALIWKASKKR